MAKHSCRTHGCLKLSQGSKYLDIEANAVRIKVSLTLTRRRRNYNFIKNAVAYLNQKKPHALQLNLMQKADILSATSELICHMRILFWRSLVIIFIILGFIGALLPGMPTTVFLILAAWAASKGWPQMDAWLLNHPKYGPTLRDWRANGTVPRRAKWIASGMMLISGIIMLFTSAPIWVKVFTDVTMFSVAVWLWTRPEQPTADAAVDAAIDVEQEPAQRN